MELKHYRLPSLDRRIKGSSPASGSLDNSFFPLLPSRNIYGLGGSSAAPRSDWICRVNEARG
jgi:hypothetical protein